MLVIFFTFIVLFFPVGLFAGSPACINGFKVLPDDGVTLQSAQNENKLRVVDDGVYRSLFFRHTDGGELLGSQINLMQPEVPVLSDTRELLASFLLAPEQGHVMVVGMKNIGLIKFLRSFTPAQFIDVSDSDPSIISAADAYFGLRSDDRLTVRQDINLDYLLSRPEGTYDVVYLDQFSVDDKGRRLSGIFPILRESGILRAVRERLNETGVMMAVLRGDRRRVERDIDQVIQEFPHVFVWDAQEEGSVVLAAVKRRQIVNPLVFRERARKLDQRANSGFSFIRFIDPMVAGEYRVMGI
ncbi:hypothetical protein [Parendozoicomonas sp. Alg238-R29]|uniref:hypothetical protein n=1 Tax=Parendozoicomonas sp. Alg238-R29 TaxID=2993446 RepID=UPI00248D4CEA|nr:hypothetical protein [Parendozoicomonas sp. Alg238-R29]